MKEYFEFTGSYSLYPEGYSQKKLGNPYQSGSYSLYSLYSLKKIIYSYIGVVRYLSYNIFIINYLYHLLRE